MNKRDREQLRASMTKDVVQSQGEHSRTRELLKQYASLEGIVTGPEPDESLQSPPAEAAENTLAPHATVALHAVVGRVDYSAGDLVEAVKCVCAREGVPFENDIFNEFVG